jgi:DNA-binding transcriptional ArsR family regulator
MHSSVDPVRAINVYAVHVCARRVCARCGYARRVRLVSAYVMHVYEVMAEPIRRRIVEVLATGEHSVGILEALICLEFGVGRSAVQHHLKLMKLHNVILPIEAWPGRDYRLNDRFINKLEKQAKALRKSWKKRTGWNVPRDPLKDFDPPVLNQTGKGKRGHRRDPDDPWTGHPVLDR